MVKKISEQEFKEAESSKVAVVDFSAEWCGPCKMLAPVLEKVSEELEGKADFFNVDVDENPGLAEKYGIISIPALLVMKEGKKQEMQVGFQPKEAIRAFLEQYL